ncbi:hypothetical protein [Cohnella zeiphila]|uniref:Flagellar protein n=1 Tax=Cohnella zeiphila TaxID=2761120 RepID=A0A7X0VVW9_9BACL|nr:hypothetical protein [Cohnella zeiphila]MBB6731812.1 hypothetical protein [Cohnella zeiphila]
MAIGLQVDQCPGCGGLYRANSRHLCPNCSAEEDGQLQTIERQLRRNRFLNNEQVAELASVRPERIRSWIRNGKLKLYDYPNLSDECDLCSQPIRSGKLCGSCVIRIQEQVRHEYEQDRLMKERRKVAHSYFSHR